MTAVVVGVFIHPNGCPVCGGTKTVGLSPVGPLLVGGRRAEGQPANRVVVASRLSEVVPCPQCQGADLVHLLRRGPDPDLGGAA